MFKRANKITSLLVAAASVMALVPAYAADVKKVDSEDGTVYNAVAYKDGKFYVDGEINDDEEAYYVANGKYNKLEDVDSGDDVTAFGEKYLDVSDGDYTVDLDKGSVTDDNIVDDTFDDAATSLRKKIKDDTDDRYVKGTSGTDVVKADTAMLKISGAKYAEPWYATAYAPSGTANSNNGTIATAALNVYTDTKGNYIDADYNLGKIKVTTTTASATKTVTVENTNDKYDSANASDKVTVSVRQIGQPVAQDKDNIYRFVTVRVKADTTIKEINNVAVNAAANVFNIVSANEVTYTALQKISKAQASDDVDGAKYAKTVTTYAVADSDGKKLGGDTLITDANTQFTVVNGKFVAYSTKLNSGKVTARAYSLKTDNGFYYLDEEDESKEDVESKDSVAAAQTDVDGNLWRLDGGYIYKFDNTDDWDKVYKVDGSFDELQVYDKDNMVAWSEDDDVYSLIGGKSKTDETKTTETTTPATTTTAAAGWVKNTDGTWSYNKAGVKATGWVQDGAWYYLNANGIMQTGWQNVGGTWYYLNASGAMQTGWVNDNGTWYYCNASGAMLSSTVVDGYVLGANGAWVK